MNDLLKRKVGIYLTLISPGGHNFKVPNFGVDGSTVVVGLMRSTIGLTCRLCIEKGNALIHVKKLRIKKKAVVHNVCIGLLLPETIVVNFEHNLNQEIYFEKVYFSIRPELKLNFFSFTLNADNCLSG